MKIAVCKIGANITFSAGNKSAANADIMYFLRQLEIDDHDITICTARTRNTQIPKRLKFEEVKDIKSFDDFDTVLVFNGSINFFGGAIDHNLLALYRALHNSSVEIVWVHTDGQCLFRQLWPAIWKREWAQGLTEEEFFVDPEQVTYLTQGYSLGKVKKLIEAKGGIRPSKLVHYPLASTIMAKHEKYVKPNPIPYSDRKYDLMFGGATRNTYKRKKIEYFYGRQDLDTYMFGNLRGVNCGHPIHPRVGYQQVIRMYHNARATVIIGDDFYSDNFVTLRYWESMLADNIVFIDSAMDPNHNMVGLHINRAGAIDVGIDVYDHWSELRSLTMQDYNFERMREILVETLS